jgi:hypothetical protein
MTGGIAGGQTGLSAVWDTPISSPESGVYLGIEVCDIEYDSKE